MPADYDLTHLQLRGNLFMQSQLRQCGEMCVQIPVCQYYQHLTTCNCGHTIVTSISFYVVFLVFKACNYSIFVFYLQRYIFPLFQTMSVSGTSHRKCLNIPDSFCYICGSFTIPSHMKNISTFVNKTYFAYLKVKLGDQDKSWGPHKVCKQWVDSLRMWTKGTRDKLAFVIPILWREQKHYCTDCYFCLVKTSGFNKKKKSKIEYANLPSAIKPVPHLNEILVKYLL